MVFKIAQEIQLFEIFLMIPDGKGGCYTPEICNQTGFDILGGTGNIVPKYGIRSILPALALFFHLSLSNIGLLHLNEN